MMHVKSGMLAIPAMAERMPLFLRAHIRICRSHQGIPLLGNEFSFIFWAVEKVQGTFSRPP